MGNETWRGQNDGSIRDGLWPHLPVLEQLLISNTNLLRKQGTFFISRSIAQCRHTSFTDLFYIRNTDQYVMINIRFFKLKIRPG